MNKLIMKCVIASLLIAGCDNDESVPLNYLDKKVVVNCADSIINNYTSNHSDWAKNDVIKKESILSVLAEIQNALADGRFVQNMNFVMDGIVAYDEAGKTKYLCNFNLDATKNRSIPMHFQLLGIVNEKMKNELVQGRLYRLKIKSPIIRSDMSISEDAGQVREIFLPTVRATITAISLIR